MSVNKAILIGRLGRDPETRYTQGGTSVCNFSIATDESYTDKNGQKQQKTEWHKIVAWGKTGELCQQYLVKGKEVFIEGKIETREWQDKDGNKRYQTEIRADNVRFIGGGRRDDQASDGGGGSAEGDYQAPGYGRGAGAPPARQGGYGAAPGGGGAPPAGGGAPGPGAGGFIDEDIPF